MRVLGRILWVCAVIATVSAATMYWNPVWVSDQMLHFRMWKAGVSGGHVDLREGRIHFYDIRANGGGGTPLLLVHGLGGRAEDFAGLMPRFAAQGFHVYALDLLGYGQSAKPENGDYSIAGEEQIVAEFMDAEHIPRADVAGWSMGGWIVLRLALDQPQRVERLAVYDSAGITFQTNVDAGLFAPKDYAGVERLIRALSPTMKVPAPFVQRAIIRKTSARQWVVERSVAAMRTGRDLLDLRLSKMEPPLLIVWGAQDVLTPPSVGLTMHQVDPRSVLVTVEGCGHFAPVECAGPVAKATVDFLKAEPVMTGGEATVAGH